MVKAVASTRLARSYAFKSTDFGYDPPRIIRPQAPQPPVSRLHHLGDTENVGFTDLPDYKASNTGQTRMKETA